MQSMFPGTFQFKELGFQKKNFKIKILTQKKFEEILDSNLLSQHIDWTFDTATDEGKIWVGGFRQVGTFYKVKGDE